MKRLLLSVLGFGLSAIACAKLPDLSGTYQCHGWDSIIGDFSGVEDTLTLKDQTMDKTSNIQGYTFYFKNYDDKKEQYKGFAMTTDGVHMAAYFSNVDVKAPTDNGVSQYVFDKKHRTFSGDYYQPTFAEGNKTYDYGHVICEKVNPS